MKNSQTGTLERYVGRIVSLNRPAFDNLSRRAKRRFDADNCFLVAAVNRKMGTLICYGANMRVAVGASEVSLI